MQFRSNRITCLSSSLSKTIIILHLIFRTTTTTTTTIRTMSTTTTSLVSAAAAAIVPSSSAATTNSFYTKLPLYIQRLSEHAIIPTRGSEYAAGLDLSASEETIVKANGGRTLVKTDLRIACPPGTYVRIAPRSGLAYKFGIDVGAGVIDADYRGPVGVILFNFGADDFIIQRGDRIAQAILEQICVPSAIIDVPIDTELPKVGTRGESGFGSTGIAQVSMTVVETNDKRARTEESTTISPSTSNDTAM